MKRLLFALPLLYLNLHAAASLEGSYTGSLIFNDRDFGVHLVIQQSAGGLVVTAGRDASEQNPSSNLKVDGQHLTFEVLPAGQPAPWKFDLTAAGDQISGSVRVEMGGQVMNGKLNAARLNLEDGTYTGSLLVNGPNGQTDAGATIVVKHVGDGLAITAGPKPEEQVAATNVKREGNRLTFEVAPPKLAGDPWKFEVDFAAGKLTGSVIAFHEGKESHGKLDVKKI